MDEQTTMAIEILDRCASSREAWAAGPVSGLMIGDDPSDDEIQERRHLYHLGASRLRWISDALAHGAPLDAACASVAHQTCSAAGEWLARVIGGEWLYWDGMTFRSRV